MFSLRKKQEKRSETPIDIIEANAPDTSDSLIPAHGKESEAGPYPNPYLNARRSWNEHVEGVVQSRHNWQLIGILCLLIAIASVGGLIHIGSQSKFVPYVVEVDKLGQAVGVKPAQSAQELNPLIVRSYVACFISDARLVTPDVSLQRAAVFRIYALLKSIDPATTKMNEWLSSGRESQNPFERAAKEMISVEIQSVLQSSESSWQVDWIETTRDRQGVLKEGPVKMRALVTIYIDPPTSSTKEDDMLKNPLGIYVKDFSWNKQI